MITIERISYDEALRYLGDKDVEMNQPMQELMRECEKELLAVIKPAYLYKKVLLKDYNIIQGNAVKAHMSGCDCGVVMCATVGGEVDKLIRLTQITDMAKAVIFDSMASVAVEELSNKVDIEISENYTDYNATWRFSPGYGDYPIELQKDFLNILDASKKIGLCTNDNYFLTPTKSITGILGLSKEPIEKKRSNCINCNLFKTCKFRKAGNRCEF